jgi:hypothetical protein
VFSYCILLFAAAAPGQSPGGNTIAECEIKAVAARRQFVRGEVVLTQALYLEGAKKPNQTRVTAIWFDGTKCRNDILHNSAPGGMFRDVNCKNCQFPGTYLTFSDSKSRSDFDRVALSISELTAGRKPESMPVTDPRCLGMVADSSPNLCKYGIDATICRPDRQRTSVETVDFSGARCQLVKYEGRNGHKARIWIVPAWGYSVLQIEIGEGEDDYSARVHSEVANIPGTSLWFPTKCTYSYRSNGREVQKEVVDVEIKSMNQPLDEGHFRLSGMDIPLGKTVLGVPGAGAKPFKWDGSALVEDLKNDTARPVIVRGTRPTSYLLCYVGAGVLVSFAALLLYRAYRSK